MITNADIKKMREVFATKEELKALDTKMDRGFVEIIKYIGETREEIVTLLSKQINDFRQEMRDIAHNHQSRLDNHDSRISHLEFANK